MAQETRAMESSELATSARAWKSGKNSTEFESLVLGCNKDGMDHLRQGNYRSAFEQLKYAEALLVSNQGEGEKHGLLAVTCNNLGCYYKRTGKLHAALSYLRQALKVEVALGENVVTVAGTHLNICALFSAIEKHDKALLHAQHALEMLGGAIDKDEASISEDVATTLVIAHHNVAVQREHMREWDQAALAYRAGWEIAQRNLGPAHPLTGTLEKNCSAVIQKSPKKERPKLAGDSTASPPAANSASPGESQFSSPKKRFVTAQASPASSSLSALVPSPPKELDFPPIPRALAALERIEGGGGGRGSFSTFSKTQERSALENEYVERDTAAIKPYDPADTSDSVRDYNRMRSPMRAAYKDYRPNRVISGATRTSLVLRKHGFLNDTSNRDNVTIERLRLQRRQLAGSNQNRNRPSRETEQRAATKIQQVWRMWRQYIDLNRDYLEMLRVCATAIQARWRGYHVLRERLDSAAAAIQRHIRGVLVRHVLRRNNAAVRIQRRAIGVLCRKRLRHLNAC